MTSVDELVARIDDAIVKALELQAENERLRAALQKIEALILEALVDNPKGGSVMTADLVSYAPRNLEQLEAWAKDYAGAFQGQYRGKPQDVVLAVMWGSELGLKPLQSLAAIAVINGKPALYGDQVVGLAEKYGKIVSRREGFTGKPYDDDFTAWCDCTTPNGDVFHQEFSVADAKQAKLWGKQGPWQTNPKRMLQFRARNFCVRDAAPDLGLGPSAEEMHEVEDTSEEQRASKARNITPPRKHADGRVLDPLENVNAAIAEAAEPVRVQAVDEEIARDPLGINGSGRKKAVAMLKEGLVSARTAADAQALADAYQDKIRGLDTQAQLELSKILEDRIEAEYPARVAAQREFLEGDEGELLEGEA